MDYIFCRLTDHSKKIFKGLIGAYVIGGITSIFLWGYYFYEGIKGGRKFEVK